MHKRCSTLSGTLNGPQTSLISPLTSDYSKTAYAFMENTQFAMKRTKISIRASAIFVELALRMNKVVSIYGCIRQVTFD